MGYKLDLDNPKTFNEKLQWLKLYNRNPEYSQMVDKYAVKEYVKNIIGEEYVVPTLGVWDSFDEIADIIGKPFDICLNIIGPGEYTDKFINNCFANFFN